MVWSERIGCMSAIIQHLPQTTYFLNHSKHHQSTPELYYTGIDLRTISTENFKQPLQSTASGICRGICLSLDLAKTRRQLKSYILGYIHYLSLFYFFTGGFYIAVEYCLLKYVFICV